MKMRTSLAIVCALALVGAGCSTQNRAVNGGNTAVAQQSPQAAWQERQRLFASMQAWRLSGRVGLQLRDDSWSFGLNWLEKGSGRYDMNITNPLTGAIMAMVQSSGSQVTLRTADGKTYQDTDAERLLAKQLRLNFPLKNLRYWARGIPAPNLAVDDVQLDAQGRPVRLQQAGWVINYPRYKGDGLSALPARIDLEQATEQVRARVVAKEWQTKL